MSEWDAIGIGLAVRDISVLMDRYPEADEKRRAEEIHESGGGPVPTALVALARYGRKTALSALVGDDSVGRVIVEDLEKENVDTSAVEVRQGYASQTSVIIVENGRRTILEAPQGVGFSLAWERVSDLPLESCDALLLDARTVETQLRAARIARSAGALIVLDCGHPREGVEELLGVTDVAVFSHTYPKAIDGDDFDTGAFIRDVQSKLPSDGPAIAGVTLGAEGCAVASRTEAMFVEPAPVVDAVDSTGAGDVFHGAFVHAYLKTQDVRRSARFANVVAARKCEGMTGRATLPPEEAAWRDCAF